MCMFRKIFAWKYILEGPSRGLDIQDKLSYILHRMQLIL